MIGIDCILGRASCTKETLPDFHEWCRVTRHSRIFCRLTGYQRTPEDWGATTLMRIKKRFFIRTDMNDIPSFMGLFKGS